MAVEPSEKFSLSAPKGIITMIATAMISFGGGYAVTARGGQETTRTTPDGVTRVDIIEVTSAAEARAKAHADAVVATTRDDCRRDLSTATTTLNNTLIRLENKVDTLGVGQEDLKVDVGTLKGRRGK